MAIKRYEIEYAGGFRRILQIDGTINVGQVLHLQKPAEDRHGPDDFQPWKVAQTRTEVRETTPGVLEDVAVLTLKKVVPEGDEPDEGYTLNG